MEKLWFKLLLTKSCSMLAPCLSGCGAAPVVPGQVVEPLQVKEPEPPKLVEQTPARPMGYYRKLVLDALRTP